MNSWRSWLFKLNRHLHRDIGYFCVGLTVIYAVSGIAVNHIADWNPNYTFDKKEEHMSGVPPVESESFISFFQKQLEIKEPFRSLYRESPTLTRLYFENFNLTWDSESQTVQYEKLSERPGLFAFNFLHLNHAKKTWTLVADIFSVLLIYLALSGLFMLTGRHGFWNRGVWFVLTGVIIPLFLFYYYH